MSVSERDRNVMRRIGAAKAAGRAAAHAEHLALPLDERLRRSWRLYAETRGAAKRREADDPTPFYERARALKLYRP
jgi:hypothetical protein